MQVMTAMMTGSGDHNIGDEVEVHSVLFLDQQTFYGMKDSKDYSLITCIVVIM